MIKNDSLAAPLNAGFIKLEVNLSYCSIFKYHVICTMTCNLSSKMLNYQAPHLMKFVASQKTLWFWCIPNFTSCLSDFFFLWTRILSSRVLQSTISSLAIMVIHGSEKWGLNMKTPPFLWAMINSCERNLDS